MLTIENVCNELNLKYAHLRKTVEDKTENKKALLTMNCFKGKCTHCSKLRHKGSMCWYANGKDRKGKHGKKPMYKKHVTCFNCGKKGHYQSECPYDDHNEEQMDVANSMLGLVLGDSGINNQNVQEDMLDSQYGSVHTYHK